MRGLIIAIEEKEMIATMYEIAMTDLTTHTNKTSTTSST
jgi:hypothetical protein